MFKGKFKKKSNSQNCQNVKVTVVLGGILKSLAVYAHHPTHMLTGYIVPSVVKSYVLFICHHVGVDSF